MAFYVTGFHGYRCCFGKTGLGWLCPFGLCRIFHKIPVGKTQMLAGGEGNEILEVRFLRIVGNSAPYGNYGHDRSGETLVLQLHLPVGNDVCRYSSGCREREVASCSRMAVYLKLVILASILILFRIFVQTFCRYLCPLGAVYGFFNPIALYRFRIDEGKCIRCGACQKACKLNIKTYENPTVWTVFAGDCQKACPEGVSFD